jgi:proteasome lid subunit RPN8/RPN11
VQPAEFANAREQSARHNRYLLTAEDVLYGEMEAARLDLEVIGVSTRTLITPTPSEFDREWAMPFLSYVITSVQSGKALESRSWLLSEDRSSFTEETIIVLETI